MDIVYYKIVYKINIEITIVYYAKIALNIVWLVIIT